MELPVRRVFCPMVILEEAGVNDPMATSAIQALPLQVLPLAQLAVTVLVASTVPSPFLRLKTVCGLAT